MMEASVLKRNEIRALADEAYAILEGEESEAAIERALKVLANAPQDPESYLLMSEVAEENERADLAVMWLDRGLVMHPQHEALLLKKASLLIDAFEEIDEAFSILLQIAERFKNKSDDELKSEIGDDLVVDIYLLLADCYRLRLDFLQALHYAKLAKKFAPLDENALLAAATAHFEVGDYDHAMELIEPIDDKRELSDFYWLKAQILCAENKIDDADSAFARAHKLDKTRYHRPVRLDEREFTNAFEQALLALPREIRDFIQNNAVEIYDVVPIDLVRESNGKLSPESCITIEAAENAKNHDGKFISIFKRNIENLAARRTEIKDLIASALLHELGKLAANT